MYNAWEMERHHAAERAIFPEVLDALQSIREAHPSVVIGAVTDGKADPMLMPFTLGPYFDFCVGWEDDQGGRKRFFEELGRTEEDTQLKWIYEAALEKYRAVSDRKTMLGKEGGDSDVNEEKGDFDDDFVWIHVGDDLAYDVGGSSACGARTILMDLNEKYGQTAKLMFASSDGKSSNGVGGGTKQKRPGWAFRPSPEEVAHHEIMNDRARGSVHKTVKFVSGLTDAIEDILEEA